MIKIDVKEAIEILEKEFRVKLRPKYKKMYEEHSEMTIKLARRVLTDYD